MLCAQNHTNARVCCEGMIPYIRVRLTKNKQGVTSGVQSRIAEEGMRRNSNYKSGVLERFRIDAFVMSLHGAPCLDASTSI